MPLHVYPNKLLSDFCVISDNPEFGVFNEDEDAVGVLWEEIPALITALRRAYNNRPQPTP